MKPLNHKERINLQDSGMDVFTKLSDGNPGGLTVMMQAFRINSDVDPDDCFGSFGPMVSLDTHGIYGSNIWILYKDCCGENITGFLAVLRSIQMGLLSETEVWKHIDYSIPFNVVEVLAALQEKLPKFGKNKVSSGTK